MVASLLQRFDRVMAASDEAARRLRRSGVRPWRLETTGALEDAPLPLAHNDAEREALARVLRGRPVWLAARLPEAEEATVFAAHARSLRHLHRLLLVVVPEDPSHGVRLAEQATAPAIGGTAPLRVALRSRDEDLTEQTEVYIADTEGELGLWYRLAPITFLGGSLAGPASLCHPFAPALLGSVVLHGPMRARFGNAIDRLTAGKASVMVDTAQSLSDVIVDLSAPDQAALRAQAAWSVVTTGAEATDRLADLLLSDLSDRASQPVSPAQAPQPVPADSASLSAIPVRR
jgi:3-deoxy-D-manno-octulosonic-acid transferase